MYATWFEMDTEAWYKNYEITKLGIKIDILSQKYQFKDQHEQIPLYRDGTVTSLYADLTERH